MPWAWLSYSNAIPGAADDALLPLEYRHSEYFSELEFAPGGIPHAKWRGIFVRVTQPMIPCDSKHGSQTPRSPRETTTTTTFAGEQPPKVQIGSAANVTKWTSEYNREYVKDTSNLNSDCGQLDDSTAEPQMAETVRPGSAKVSGILRNICRVVIREGFAFVGSLPINGIKLFCIYSAQLKGGIPSQFILL
jgi:hypothetical protein